MFVIIEGCDGSGKTTLAKQIGEEIRLRHPHDDIQYLQRGQPKVHPFMDYERAVESYRPGQGQHIIADRWHWGELIYGPLYRGESKLAYAGFMHVEMFLRAKGAAIAFLDVPEDIIRRRLAKRGDEDFLQDHDIGTVIAAYRDLAQRSLLRNTFTQRQVPREIVDIASRLEANATKVNPFSTFIGVPSHPQVLLLGETLAQPKKHSVAFVPYPATSGHYLLNTFPPRFFSGLAIANACDEDVRALVTAVHPEATVALGRKASKALEDAKVNPNTWGAVPHPQYWRRFHFHEHEQYLSLITDAITRNRKVHSWPTS